MTDNDKKIDYERPVTHQLGDDNLEDVAGGAPQVAGVCGAGQDAPASCAQGQTPNNAKNFCQEGQIPRGTCAVGRIAHL